MGTPPAASTSTFAQRGYSVLTFGTEGQNTAAFGTGGSYIAVSVTSHIEGSIVITAQGSGIPAVRTDIITSKQYRITVEDDTNITPPSRGMRANFCDCMSNVSGLAPQGTNLFPVAQFIVDDAEFSVERGAIGTRVILATGYPLITAANGGAYPNINN